MFTIIIPDYIMTIRRKDDFINKRSMTTKFFESFSRFKTMYSIRKKNENVNVNNIVVIEVYIC